MKTWQFYEAQGPEATWHRPWNLCMPRAGGRVAVCHVEHRNYNIPAASTWIDGSSLASLCLVVDTRREGSPRAPTLQRL